MVEVLNAEEARQDFQVDLPPKESFERSSLDATDIPETSPAFVSKSSKKTQIIITTALRERKRSY